MNLYEIDARNPGRHDFDVERQRVRGSRRGASFRDGRVRPVEAALAELKQRLGEIMDLARTQYLQQWDMEVLMPPRGESSRTAAIGTLQSIVHARQIDERIGELVDELEPYAASLPHDADDACLDSRRTPRLGEAAEDPDRPRHRAGAHAGRGVRRLGQGARGLRLRGVPAAPGEDPRAPAPPDRVLRALRRPVRRAARQLRGGHAHRGGADDLRAAAARDHRSWSQRTPPTRTRTSSRAGRSRSRSRKPSRES